MSKIADKLLIDAYKQLRVNIAKNPTQKNTLIIQYMDIVDTYTKQTLLVTNEKDKNFIIETFLNKKNDNNTRSSAEQV